MSDKTVGLAVILASGAVLALAAGRPMQRAADREILARTIWAEARGEGAEGMAAVAAVIMNRVADPRWPSTVRAVCLQPWQFSAWNEDDPNREKAAAVTEEDPLFAIALRIAERALQGALPDPTGGANHYHTRRVAPYWARDMERTADIGVHRFYRG